MQDVDNFLLFKEKDNSLGIKKCWVFMKFIKVEKMRKNYFQVFGKFNVT